MWSGIELPFESQSTLCSDGKLVFVYGFEGEVCAFDLTSGEMIWTLTLECQSASNPACLEGKLLLCGLGGELHCIETQDGKWQWTRSAGSVITSSPALSPGWAASVYARARCR